MNNPIKLCLFCSEESFRSQFAARLLTFYGAAPKAEQQNTLSEDDVIEKLQNAQHPDIPLKFLIDQLEFEIVWKNDAQIEKGRERENNITLFLLLLEFKQEISQSTLYIRLEDMLRSLEIHDITSSPIKSILQTLQEYEIQKNCLFVIIDKISYNRKDSELQSYESDVLEILNSNLSVLVNETHILTVMPEISQESKVLICDKFKEIVKTIFEASHIKVENQKSEENLNDSLTKICQQYGIKQVKEFIEDVKKGDFQLGCSKIKDRKARKILMETLTSFTLLNQFILKSKPQIKNEMLSLDNQSNNTVISAQLSQLAKIERSNSNQNTSNLPSHQNFTKEQNNVKQQENQLHQESSVKKAEYNLQQTLQGDIEYAKFNTENKSSFENIIKQKDTSELRNSLRGRKTIDSISQLKWAVSQDLILILKQYLSDPEVYLDCLFAEKTFEVLQKVKKSEQHLFLQRINDCQSYQQYLCIFSQSKSENRQTKDQSITKLFQDQSEKQKLSIPKQIGQEQAKFQSEQTKKEFEQGMVEKEIKKKLEEMALIENSEEETGTTYDENGERYQGEYKNGKRDGKGVLFYANGDRYIGEFQNGLREGKGTHFYKDGDRYEGEYRNDKEDGKGVYLYADKNKYVGLFKNGLMDGIGIFLSANGNKYQGQWKNGKMEGKGTLFKVDGGKYEGYWKNAKMEGKGILLCADGSKYEGQFQNGQKNGKGTHFFSDGDKFEGQWKDGNMEGKGTLFFADGTTHQGQWKDGKMHGKGALFCSGGKYEGQWKDGSMERKGTMTFVNGDKYEGQWKGGKMEGKGTFFNVDGGKYEGQWKNGKKNGRGIEIDVKGKQIKGIWKDGQRSDCHIF